MLFDVGRASGTKLCRLLWNTNLVEIAVIIVSALVAIKHWYRGVPLQRSTLCLKMVSLYLDTVRPMIMTYILLLHCLHPYLLQLSFCHYSYYYIETRTSID